jgi:hypothetical protein
MTALTWAAAHLCTDGVKSLEQQQLLWTSAKPRRVAKWRESRIEGLKTKATSEIGNEVAT